MGLKEFRKWKKEKELQESETIVTLLKRIDDLEKRLKKLEGMEPLPVHLTADEKTKMKMAQDKATKPQDFINLFTGNLEEFNPNA